MTQEQQELKVKILALLKYKQSQTWEEIRRTLPDPDSHIACELHELQTKGLIRVDVFYSIINQE